MQAITHNKAAFQGATSRRFSATAKRSTAVLMQRIQMHALDLFILQSGSADMAESVDF